MEADEQEAEIESGESHPPQGGTISQSGDSRGLEDRLTDCLQQLPCPAVYQQAL